MPEELMAKNKIEILSVGFAFWNQDSDGMSIYYGPHECTALFVSGITSPIGKKECEAMQKAIASALDGDMEPRPNLRAPRITPNDADCKGCPERRPGLVWGTEPPTVPGWYWQRLIGRENTCTMAWITLENKKLRCKSIFGDRQLTRFKGFEWAGPIPMPEELTS